MGANKRCLSRSNRFWAKVLACLSAVIAFSSCDEENKSVVNRDGVCTDVSCGGHGTCLVSSDNAAVCLCNSGYHASMDAPAQCVQDEVVPNPCASVDCGGHGTCLVSGDNTAVCLCNSGYHASMDAPAQCVQDEVAQKVTSYHMTFYNSGISHENWDKMVSTNSGWAVMDKSSLEISY